MSGSARAAEVWGHVTSVDARFGKVIIRHVGVYDKAEFRIGPDTEFRLPDGRVWKHVALDSLVDLPVFATVEETRGRYAMKVWVLRGEPRRATPPGAGGLPDSPGKGR
jgi:hypothetical protein